MPTELREKLIETLELIKKLIPYTLSEEIGKGAVEALIKEVKEAA